MNPLLDSYEPKKGIVQDLLADVKNARQKRADTSFEDIVQNWRSRTTIYPKKIGENGQKPQEFYNNGELIGLSRNSFFNTNKKPETQIALEDLVNKFGKETFSGKHYLSIIAR